MRRIPDATPWRVVPLMIGLAALLGGCASFSPDGGMSAVQDVADAAAAALTKIDLAAHDSTKQRLRKPAIERVRAAIDSEITLDAYRRRSRESQSG